MRIYFVRHGHPDYSKDCLTALGHKQAISVAERLNSCDIKRVFASTMGRATQTAEYTAKKLGLEVIPCDFAREISWGVVGDPLTVNSGNPWALAEQCVSEGGNLCDPDWCTRESYCNNKILRAMEDVIKGFDAWLETFGYKREGDYYRVTGEKTCETVALFGHGGASLAMFSHLFNIPFPQLIGFFHIAYTGVTVIELPNTVGNFVFPKLLSTDAYHIVGLDSEKNVYGN